MIKFNLVRYKNMLSSGNYWTEIQLDDKKHTLSMGSNGSGKSTLLDAVCFGLFGKAFRNITKSQIVNSINQKDCVVEIEFTAHNKEYKVVRGIKPNVFEIWQNGQKINQEAATKDYQEILEKSILKLNYKSFTQIVVLGSASFTPFMQLSSSDRRTIIEDLLDIQIFSTMNKVIKDRMSNNKDLIKDKKYNLDMATQKYEMQNKYIENLKQNNEDKIYEHETEIENTQKNIEQILSEVNIINEQVSDRQSKVSSKLDIEKRLREMTKIESQIESKILNFENDIEFFKHNDSCPTCRQSIQEEFKISEIKSIEEKYNEKSAGLQKLQKTIESERQKLRVVENEQKEIQSLQVKVAKYNTTIQEKNTYIEKLKSQIRKLKSDKNITNEEYEKLNEFKHQIENIQQELRTLIEENSYYETASVLLKDDGIKTKIIKQYLPIINKLVNKYLTSLDFFVNFNLDESFKETIKSRHRDDFTYNNFSEGEKAKINLALMFAWRTIAKIKNSANTNLLIMDEIIDSALDSAGIDNFFKLIHSMDDGTSVFVISPKGDGFVEKFDKVIKFDKIKGFSRMAVS
jgi:DNA repair exonuclease SbcCD ATPase subunit